MELRDIKGIGPKTEALFNKIGVFTPEDLLRDYPAAYDAYTAPVPIGEVTVGAKCAVEGTLARGVTMRKGQRVTVITTEISDPTGRLQLIWFNAPYLSSMLKRGSVFVFRGIVREKNGRRTMEHPEILTPAQYEELQDHLVPVYALTKGLSGKLVKRSVRSLLDNGELIREYLPDALLHLLGLPDEGEALRGIHFPENENELLRARNRLVFDELFLFVLGMRTLKAGEAAAENHFPMKKSWESEKIIEALPYKLTGAQMRVWREIERDLTGEHLMSRLIEGDVGSGKTVIAFLAIFLTCSNGYQTALMAPTEVLARQHYDKLCKFCEEQHLDYVRPVLLTGSLKAAARRSALDGIQSGAYNVVVGTHALFQDAVQYKSLGLVITDEQHRFGVKQREALADKSGKPNMLVMSATPIPRTLGVIYYGDLALSVIDERPARRLPIKNAVVDASWMENATRFIGKQLTLGRQAYVVCPMIEPDEELRIANVTEETARLKKAYPDQHVEMLHGRMKDEEKNRIMDAFLAHEIDVLVSTTVIEVGVDVPNATVMMVEHAERFGLAQLHQLRGRVGRGEYQSYCIFMTGQKSEETEKRLGILRESNDGFAIAEKDLELRGPGDLLGVRQSGSALFALADLTRDGEVLKMAGQTAAAILADDPDLIHEEHLSLKAELNHFMTANERKIIL